MRSAALFFFALIAGTAAVLIPELNGGGERGGAVTIRMVVWGMPFEDRLFEDVYARGHEKLNPLVTVDYQRHSDPVSKYNAWHANREGAEVMRLGVDNYLQFVDRGMLAPLDEYLALPAPYGLSQAERDNFPPGMLDLLRIDGKLYGLPQDSAQFGLYYNKAIFDAYNAEHPDDPLSYPSPDWSWQDLRDAARKLTTRDAAGRIDVAGLDMVIWAWPFFNLFGQAGGVAWSDDGLTTYINSAAGVKALEFMRTLIVEDKSWQPYFGQEQGTGQTSRFGAGRTAMMFGGSWWAPSLDGNYPGLDYAISAVPHGEVAAVPCGMVLWTMSANAKHKLEGWRMIRWLIEGEQAEAYWDALRVAPPANLNVINSPGFRESDGIAQRDSAGSVIDGRYDVPPMPRDKFEDRAAWLAYAWTPDPVTGKVPGYVMVGRYQQQLQAELQTALETFLNDPQNTDPQALLDRVARRVHEQIDRERAAAGQPAVKRD